jgi:hypothetical protein
MEGPTWWYPVLGAENRRDEGEEEKEKEEDEAK